MDCKLSIKSYGVSVLAACHRVFRLQKQTFFVFVFFFLSLYILSVLKNWVFFKLLIFNFLFFFSNGVIQFFIVTMRDGTI